MSTAVACVDCRLRPPLPHRPVCGTCHARRYRKRNPAAARARDLRYYRRHREQLIQKNNARRRKRSALEQKLDAAVSFANARARREGIPGRLTRAAVEARIAYFGWRCWRCGAPWEHIDHVLRVADGGPNWPANIRPSCEACNTRNNGKEVGVSRP